MIEVIAWIVGGGIFILPAFVYYFSFYIERLGWILGLLLSVFMIHTLFPLHFIISPLFGGDGFWAALWGTWGRVIVGSVIVWIITQFSRR
jgi:hypothetical protein